MDTSLPNPPSWRLSPSRSVGLPCVMAILNATPDSFYAGSRHPTLNTALAAINAGAAILDIGPESSRPGSDPIPADEQIRRAIPLIAAVRAADPNIAITIDTTSSQVAAAALDAGADAINDISAGRDDPQMFPLAAARNCGLILMHRLVIPKRDRYSDQYTSDPPMYGDDVVHEVGEFLRERSEAAIAAGVARERIVVDPGLGFGKTVEQNLELIQNTGTFVAMGYPVLSGLSRKSFVGRVYNKRGDTKPEERLPGTLALSRQHLAYAAPPSSGVHDTCPTRRRPPATPGPLPKGLEISPKPALHRSSPLQRIQWRRTASNGSKEYACPVPTSANSPTPTSRPRCCHLTSPSSSTSGPSGARPAAP